MTQLMHANKQNALHLGHARVDITPEVGIAMGGYAARDHGATGIADRLYADVLYIRQGHTKLMWVTLDLIGVAEKWGWTARERLACVADVPAHMVTLLPSHTHFGPSTGDSDTSVDEQLKSYVETLFVKLEETAKVAVASTEPVSVYIGVSDVSEIVYNRRLRRPDGTVFTAFRLPPPPEESEGTFGPVDPELTAIRFNRLDGSTKLLLYSAAIHPVVGVDAFYDISADYPGVTRRIVEAALDVPVVFALGTAANLVPIQRGPGQRERIGTFLAGALLQAMSQTTEPVRPSLSGHHERIVVPTDERPPLEDGNRRLAEMNAALEKAKSDGDQQHTQRLQGEIDRLQVMLSHSQSEGPGNTLSMEVTAVALGDLGVVALPGEIFVETGARIRALSPFPRTLVLSMANQSTGYLATRTAFWEGGYEANVSMFQPGSEAIVIDNAVATLVNVWDAQRKAEHEAVNI